MECAGLSNCRKCGRLIANNSGEVFCKSCGLADESTFKALKDYIYDNPGVSVYELSMLFKINVKTVRRYVEEGRLKTF